MEPTKKELAQIFETTADKDAECKSCKVPLGVHGTVCGWVNARQSEPEPQDMPMCHENKYMKKPEELLKRGTGNFLHCTDYEDAIEAMKEYGKQCVEAAYGRIKIGKFELSMMPHDKIWIQENDGGEFDAKAIEDVIEKFYNDNF